MVLQPAWSNPEQMLNGVYAVGVTSDWDQAICSKY